MKAELLGFRTVQVRSFVFTWDVVVQLTVKLVWSTALQTAEILQAVCEDWCVRVWSLLIFLAYIKIREDFPALFKDSSHIYVFFYIFTGAGLGCLSAKATFTRTRWVALSGAITDVW